MGTFEEEIQLINEIESEVERFQEKVKRYKQFLAEERITSSYSSPSKSKHRAAVKRASMDLKQILHKI